MLQGWGQDGGYSRVGERMEDAPGLGQDAGCFGFRGRMQDAPGLGEGWRMLRAWREDAAPGAPASLALLSKVGHINPPEVAKNIPLPKHPQECSLGGLAKATPLEEGSFPP